MTPKQEQALREYLHKGIVPLIEDVLFKKLGQALDFVAETAPPRKEWVGLTDQDVQSIEDKHLMSGIEFDGESGYWAVYRAIEAKLKEKNT